MRACGFCLAFGLAAGAVGSASGGPAAGKPPAGAILVPYELAQFEPIDPERPELVQIAVLQGDPNEGPNSMLMKMKKYQGTLHHHSSDYELVVIAGRMRHWYEGQAEADAPVLGAGSYWYQPKMQAHADSCLSDSCVMFITWSGKRDAFPGAPK